MIYYHKSIFFPSHIDYSKFWNNFKEVYHTKHFVYRMSYRNIFPLHKHLLMKYGKVFEIGVEDNEIKVISLRLRINNMVDCVYVIGSEGAVITAFNISKQAQHPISKDKRYKLK